MFEILIPLIVGLVIGVIAGMTPGLHPNSAIPIMAGLTFFFNPLAAAIILISSTVVNSFVSMIPSILLGAPEDSDVLSVLPGHKLLLEGRGYEAIRLTVIGSLGGMLFSLALLPLFYFVIPPVYEFIKPFIHILLILVVGYMVLIEKGFKRKIYSILIFFAAGILGFLVLNFSDKMIFPLLSGLFGLPLLLLSLFTKTSFPKKNTFDFEKLKVKRMGISSLLGSLAGIITGLLPGVGSAQATLIAQAGNKSNDPKDFLMSIGAVTTANVIYSILALWIIGKGRSGVAIAVSELVNIDFQYVMIFLVIIAISSGFASYITLKLTRPVLSILKKVNYCMISLFILILLFSLIFIFSGVLGLFVGIVALSIGLIPNFVSVKRTHCMGCLILLVIMNYI